VTTLYQFPDTDGDGIEDRWDSCVNQPENFNSYLDKDGCPDVEGAKSTIPTRPDTDNDGYPDTIDSCPQSPETWNKYDDTDGCPDITP
ncbi:MAG: thrombospondin type 3 repeat-containing protein, partial [Nitrosarchaeum sp.]|nr:thrombospondin type 3 repeat-containing protein [Nitrosarchaeum sp.]